MKKDLSKENTITVIKGNGGGEVLVVFQNLNDLSAFQKLLQVNKKEQSQELICLHSEEHIENFTAQYNNHKGRIYLILEGNKKGDEITTQLCEAFKNTTTLIQDVRNKYNINSENNQSISNYLSIKYPKNENSSNQIGSPRISNISKNGDSKNERNAGQPLSKEQSQQNEKRNHGSGQDVDSKDAGNGSLRGTAFNAGSSRTNQQNAGNHGTANKRRSSLLATTNSTALDRIIESAKGQKITNEQIGQIVNLVCRIDKNHTVHLNEEIKITEEVKTLISQYRTGGVAKEGRGILDEYYTNPQLVQTVGNLLQQELTTKDALSVLEPSVGIGNFINAVENLPNATINTFEINETTAKITKILYPDAKVNLRSFESEFITENGNKKNKIPHYDLVIGNPPYGEHRGFYKGLGEEPKLAKYEDYFVKRN